MAHYLVLSTCLTLGCALLIYPVSARCQSYTASQILAQGQPKAEGCPDVTMPAGSESRRDSGQSGVSNSPSHDKQPTAKGAEDRRWIMKQREMERTKTPVEKPIPFKWKDEAQKAKCEPLKDKIRESFVRARHFSIQGDACKTAEHARGFMTLVDACKRECPADYLNHLGYNDRIVRNIGDLQKAGARRCPGPSGR